MSSNAGVFQDKCLCVEIYVILYNRPYDSEAVRLMHAILSSSLNMFVFPNATPPLRVCPESQALSQYASYICITISRCNVSCLPFPHMAPFVRRDSNCFTMREFASINRSTQFAMHGSSYLSSLLSLILVPTHFLKHMSVRAWIAVQESISWPFHKHQRLQSTRKAEGNASYTSGP